MGPQEISLLLYNLALIPIAFFSVVFILFTIINLFVDDNKPLKIKKLKKYPHITVQLPVFNDSVAVTCFKKCLEFNYPKDKYDIMVLDDSTDKTTQSLLKNLVKKYPDRASYIHRTNRKGFKPGAMQEAMPLVKGEIIAVFDSDFLPKKDFLRAIAVPFEDPKVGIAQGRQGFYNRDTNLISKFASYLIMIQHYVLMPLNNRINCVFFGGTCGAIRKKAIIEAGGWSAKTLTEDSELSIRILSKGYKSVFVKYETQGQQPASIEDFIKQQMRWTHGGIRTFFENAKTILFHKQFSINQRGMMIFSTIGNVIAPVVILMTFAGLAGWFLGDPQLLQISDVTNLIIKFGYTAGFFFLGGLALFRNRILKKGFWSLVLGAISLSIMLAVSNSIAIYKALFMSKQSLFGKNPSWRRTPKEGNVAIDLD